MAEDVGGGDRGLDGVMTDLLARFGGDLEFDWEAVAPAEAVSWLASFSLESRRLLAQALALFLVLEEIPPVSLPLEQVSVVLPLLEQGLLYAVSERDQHLRDDADWGGASWRADRGGALGAADWASVGAGVGRAAGRVGVGLGVHPGLRDAAAVPTRVAACLILTCSLTCP